MRNIWRAVSISYTKHKNMLYIVQLYVWIESSSLPMLGDVR